MTSNDTPVAAATGQETTGPEVLALWLESNRCIARAGQEEGSVAGASATRFVNTENASNNSAFVSSAQGRASSDPTYLRRLARKLKVNGRQGITWGRDVKIEAAGTFRRVAEIKALMDELSAALAMDTAESPWHDQALEPPAASMGNAVSWQPLARADAPRATPQAARPPRPPVNQGGGAAGAGEAGGGMAAGLALLGGGGGAPGCLLLLLAAPRDRTRARMRAHKQSSKPLPQPGGKHRAVASATS